MKKKNTQYLKFNGLELSLGNSKLGDDTIIFNMTAAFSCPSRTLGLCKLGNACYALKAEIQYPSVETYRNRQAQYWQNTTAWQIATDIVNALNSKRARVDGKLVPLANKIKYFRFNEAGDFTSQEDVTKLDIIASVLAELDIVTYGYTARKDLDFTQCNFLVKGSSHIHGNNGRTIARSQEKLDAQDSMLTLVYEERGEIYEVCKADCTICDMCKTPDGLNIVFPLH